MTGSHQQDSGLVMKELLSNLIFAGKDAVHLANNNFSRSRVQSPSSGEIECRDKNKVFHSGGLKLQMVYSVHTISSTRRIHDDIVSTWCTKYIATRHIHADTTRRILDDIISRDQLEGKLPRGQVAKRVFDC